MNIIKTTIAATMIAVIGFGGGVEAADCPDGTYYSFEQSFDPPTISWTYGNFPVTAVVWFGFDGRTGIEFVATYNQSVVFPVPSVRAIACKGEPASTTTTPTTTTEVPPSSTTTTPTSTSTTTTVPATTTTAPVPTSTPTTTSPPTSSTTSTAPVSTTTTVPPVTTTTVPTITTPTTPPTTSIPVTPTLPETGARESTALSASIAAVFVVFGAVFTVLARRRTS